MNGVMSEFAIYTNEIKKSFVNARGDKLNVLKGISINIPKEKYSVIKGASGAGKSTLLHIIGGLDKPDSGDVFIDDTQMFKQSQIKLAKFRNTHIGFVFQFHHLLPEFTALENVGIPQMIGNVNQKTAFEKAEELLEMVGLKERIDHKPAELSGGEQQRVAVARALANNPSIILADEPTGNLDTANSEMLNNLFMELRDIHKKTLLIVTHSPELEKLADVVFNMKDGLIIEN